jgi:hypothetical protein
MLRGSVIWRRFAVVNTRSDQPRADVRLQHLADLGTWKIDPDFDLLRRASAAAR